MGWRNLKKVKEDLTMRVAILSHFQSFAPSYALAVGWYERAKMLEYFGVDFTFFTAKNCPPGSYPNQQSVLYTIPGSRPYKEKVERFTNQYIELLADYDVVLTPDIIYQRKGNFLAWNQAARNAARVIRPWWCHWIHSSWVQRPNNINFKDPDSLRFTMMDRSFLVYLNEAESHQLCQMYDTEPKWVRHVHNAKDPRVFFDMHPFSWHIIKQLKLYEKEAVCIFPHCSTRMDAKGIDSVIRVMAGLKRAGLSVGLVFCNANARKVQHEIGEKRQFIADRGLVEGKDYMFTHELDEYRPMPRQVVRDLMQVSNLFVFGSWRETTGNVFQEAQITGNLLVLNQHLPCLQELADKNRTIWLDTSYKTPGRMDGQTGDLQQVNYLPNEEPYFDHLAKVRIIPNLWPKTHMWAFSFERIWHTQFKPLLDEAYKMAHSIDPPDMPKTEVLEVDAPEHMGEACELREEGGASC
jgi:hypothetical protein